MWRCACHGRGACSKAAADEQVFIRSSTHGSRLLTYSIRSGGWQASRTSWVVSTFLLKRPPMLLLADCLINAVPYTGCLARCCCCGVAGPRYGLVKGPHDGCFQAWPPRRMGAAICSKPCQLQLPAAPGDAARAGRCRTEPALLDHIRYDWPARNVLHQGQQQLHGYALPCPARKLL